MRSGKLTAEAASGEFAVRPAPSSPRSDRVVARHFEESADSYCRWVAPCFAAVHDYVLEYARAARPSRIADIACGDGRLTSRFADVAADVVGVDRSEQLLRIAHARSDRVRWISADAHSLPLPTRAFDLVICSLALSLFDRPGDALDELARIAADRGEILVVGLLAAGREGARDDQEADRRDWFSRLFAAHELPVTRSATVTSCVEIDDAETLAAILRGEVGPWSESDQIASRLCELAAVFLPAGERLALHLTFGAYHLATDAKGTERP